MKPNIKYAVFTGLAFILQFSCSESFLDNPPVGAFTDDNYVRNAEELETLLYSCYAAAALDWTFIPWGLGNIGSDDAHKGSGILDQPDLQDISLSMQTQNNEWIDWTWQYNYELIGKCNLVIDKSEDRSFPENELDRVEQIADQAKFLRALGYYHLVTLFGDVPLVEHWLESQDKMNLERSPKSQIWELIERNLKDAYNLPLKSQTEFGWVTRGAVQAMLGKACMFQREYEKAVEAYRAIIESGEYDLVDDYGLIFRYDGENCPESIFEFQEEMGVDGGHIYSWNGIWRMPTDEGAGGWGFDIPTQDLVDEFEPGDPRLLFTVNFIGDVFPSHSGEYVVQNNSSITGYTTRKAWIPWNERSTDSYFQAQNWRYCRYAEVLLFYAEALNETGHSEDAKIYLNMVRKRARNTPRVDPQRISSVWDSTYTGELLPDVTTSDQDELRTAIWHEQRVELAQEGHRREILLRTGRFKERMEAAKGDKGCNVEMHELLLPIPGIEVENSRGRITQNPGY